jgi:polysaccharide pyruvyl transferase CsaB
MTAIGICGSYGGLNVGDEAILTAAAEQLREAVPGVELTVFSREPRHTSTHHGVERVVDARRALREELVDELERLDLLLLGGGGILYDREAECYLHLPRIAQLVGVRTATFAIGAGPLQRRAERDAVAEVLNGMAGITVRDAQARRLLEEIGVDRDIVVTADPALLLTPAPLARGWREREGIRGDRPLVGVSVREPGGAAEDLQDGVYHRMLSHAADFIADRFDADLLFIPMERQDVGHSYRVISEMGLTDRATVLRGIYEPRQLLRIVGELDLAVGMRLHFLIFAALGGVPALALPYASKVTSFLEQLGCPAPALIQREHTGALLASIDRLWDLRDERRDLLRRQVPALKRQALRTAELVAELVRPELRDAAAQSA